MVRDADVAEISRFSASVQIVVVVPQDDEEILEKRCVVLGKEVGKEEVGIVNALFANENPVNGDGGLHGFDPLLVDKGEVVARHL